MTWPQPIPIGPQAGEQSRAYQDDPTLYLFLALGMKSRDARGAEEAAQVAIRGIDRLMREGPEYSAFGGTRGVILPFYEEIDPALVPEVFWRAVATRPPIGNPRLLREYLSGEPGQAPRMLRSRSGRGALRAGQVRSRSRE